MYRGVKEAIGAAAKVAQHLDLPRGGARERVQSSPDHDHLDASSQVRACLARAGIDPHGEDARLLYRWATQADGPDEYDEQAESREGAEREQVLEEGRRARARLAALLDAVTPVLLDAGVVEPPTPRAPNAWRVIAHDGRPRILRVLDPRPDDPSLIFDLDEARKVALEMLDDDRIIRTQTLISPRLPRPGGAHHDEIKDEWVARWLRGEWPSLHQMDKALAATLGCSLRWAAAIRRKWGLEGAKGRNPTTPDLQRPNMIPTVNLDGTGAPG